MAKFAFLFVDDGSDHAAAPTPEQEAVYGQIFKWFETNGSKIVHGGAELQPTSTATTIRKMGGAVRVVDGPFIESKESVGGVSIIEAADMKSAVDLAKTWPGYGVEVRAVLDM